MIALLLSLGLAADPQPTLKQVLERAAEYVAQFEQRLSGIVAEEQYAQVVKYAKGFSLLLDQRRDLRSDLLLVRPVGGTDWMQFRDVFEVDGAPVRDRAERLTQIFLNPGETTRSQTAAILSESARYNIGSLERTVNLPVLPMVFLETRNQPRFSFRRSAHTLPDPMTLEVPSPPGRFRVATEVWAIEFRERDSPTLVRTRDNPDGARLRDLPARGRVWVEPASGRVLMTEVVFANRHLRGTITVNYQFEPSLDALVPIEMRERYDRLRDKSVIEGYASYGRFRQFKVLVDEKLGPIRK